MFKKYSQTFALLLILFILSKNVVYFPSFLRSMVTGHPLILSENPPGRDFLPLKPYLENIPVAGYYTDRYDTHFWNSAKGSRIYQQAQYALAPTLLDVEQCFDHNYVIFECARAGCEKPLLKQYNLELIVETGSTISLAHKKDLIRKMP